MHVQLINYIFNTISQQKWKLVELDCSDLKYARYPRPIILNVNVNANWIQK